MRPRLLLYISLLALTVGVGVVLAARHFPARRSKLEQGGAVIFILGLALWGFGFRLAD